jgi:hypothetical protein
MAMSVLALVARAWGDVGRPVGAGVTTMVRTSARRPIPTARTADSVSPPRLSPAEAQVVEALLNGFVRY